MSCTASLQTFYHLKHMYIVCSRDSKVPEKNITVFILQKKKKKSFQSNQSRKANFLRINYQMAYVAFAKHNRHAFINSPLA